MAKLEPCLEWTGARTAGGYGCMRANGKTVLLHKLKRLRTHCIRGHEYTHENTYMSPTRSARECKLCRAINHRTYKERLSHGQ